MIRLVVAGLKRHIGLNLSRLGCFTTCYSINYCGMAEVARLLLEKNHQGILFQSQIDTVDYLNGPFVGAIDGERR